MASAFDAVGVDILAVAGEAPHRRRGGAGWRATNNPWETPKTYEDRCLHDRWISRQRLGWWLAEVPVGAGAPRRIDAVAVRWHEARHSAAGEDIDELRDAIADGRDVEIIEAKRRLNEKVVGQLLGGAPMFSDEYPGHGDLSLTTCIREPGDEALDWFCAQSAIRVEVVAEKGAEPST